MATAADHKTVTGLLSRIMLAVDLTGMVLLAAAILSTRFQYLTLFADFDVEVPALTVAVLSVPPVAVVLAFVALGGALVCLEFIVPRPSLRLAVHTLTGLSLILLGCIYVWSLLLPLAKLVESLR